MPPPDIGLLRRIADGLETTGDRKTLAAVMRSYLAEAPNGTSLDAAFGLVPVAGRLPWWRAERLDARDAALRALAGRFYAGLPVARQADEIRSVLLAYAASAWRFDRREVAPPKHYRGTPREMAFDALSACDAVPSARHIRRVLRP